MDLDRSYNDNSFNMDNSARGLLGSDSYRGNRRGYPEYKNPSFYGGIGGLTKKDSTSNTRFNQPTPRFKMEQASASSLSGMEMMMLGAAGGTSMLITAKTEAKKVTETRAQQNWKKLRKLVKTSIVEQRLNGLMGEKDKRIQQGTKIDEPIIKKTFAEKFKTFHINPKGKFLVFWKGILQFFIMFYLITYSHNLAFGRDLYDPDPINLINICVDFLVIVNMVINFFTAIKLSNNSILWNKKTMAKNYIYYGTFIPDVISLVPYEFYKRNLAAFKLLRIIHLRGFGKTLLRITNKVIPIFIGGLKAIVMAKFIASFTAILARLVLIFQLSACAWIILGYPNHIGEATWLKAVVTYDNNGDIEDFDNQIITIYVASLFHIVQTMTTIGYGNSTGYTLGEHIYSLLLLFFGLLLFVFVFEKVKHILQSLNEAETLENQQVEDLDTWLNRMERNIIENLDVVNDLLMNCYKRTLRHKVDQDWQDLFVNNEQFRHLGHKMRQEVLKVAFRHYQKRFYMLSRNISPSFMYEIFILSESRLYLAKEVIIERGSKTKGLYLVLEGHVMIAGSSPESPFVRLPVNSFFGENFLLTNKSSKFYFVADCDVSCLFIDEDVFSDLESKYSDDIKKLRSLAYLRETYFTNLEAETSNIKVRPKQRAKGRSLTRTTSIIKHSHHNINGNLQTEASTERKSLEFQKKIIVGESVSLAESTIVPKGRTSQVSPMLPRNPQKSESAVLPKARITQIAPEPFKSNKGVPSSIDNISPVRKKYSGSTLIENSPGKQRYSGSILFDSYSPVKSSQKPFDWESVLELDSNPYINENPLLEPNDEAEFQSEPVTENELGQKADKEGETTAETDDKQDEIDELNDSDIFPIECTIPDFDDNSQANQIASYLQERVVYIRNKLAHVKTKLDVDAQYLSQKAKILNKKVSNEK